MKNVWEELWHNLKSGVFINLILILLFTLFFWQSTMISSYFIDIQTSETNAKQADAEYYSLEYIVRNADGLNAMFDQNQDPGFVQNLDRTYRELHEELGNHYFVIRRTDLKLDYEELSRNFTDEELLNFYTQSQYPGYYDPSEVDLQELMHPYGVGRISQVFNGQSRRIDENAMKYFGFQVSEGRLLDEEDFRFHNGQKEIPVLLGNAYGEKYHPGDTLNGYLFGDFQLKVVGILRENTAILTDQEQVYVGTEGNADGAQEIYVEGRPVSLDYAVILPFFYIEDAPETSEEQSFASANYHEGVGGTITVPLDTPRSEINSLAKQVSSIFVRNGLPPQMMGGTSHGVVTFQQESEQTMQIFLGASIVMAILSVSGICMSMIAKLNRNLHRYGIEMMNGQSTGTVLAAFLLEMVLVMGISVAITASQFLFLIRVNAGFLAVILFLAILSAAVVALIFIRRLRKVDIEEIIRRDE